MDATARYRTFRTRTLSTVAMILGFCGIIYLGHVPLALLVLWLQVGGAGSGGRVQHCFGVLAHQAEAAQMDRRGVDAYVFRMMCLVAAV